ncbi:MAG TPA: hypothetical protein VEW48_08555 [Thermoanaerobaculia bacterium]|nr:hypothetical protein [Thermoanaerobaculia bacterium]
MAKPASVVKCEKHGLHYDSVKTSGCVLCRRESGELPPPRPGAAPAAASSATGSSSSLGRALAVTGVLVVVTAFAMQMVYGQFQEWLRNTGSSSAQTGATYQQKQMEGVLKELKKDSTEPPETP